MSTPLTAHALTDGLDFISTILGRIFLLCLFPPLARPTSFLTSSDRMSAGQLCGHVGSLFPDQGRNPRPPALEVLRFDRQGHPLPFLGLGIF